MSKASQIAAIKAIADEFLRFTYADAAPLPSELQTRHDRIKAAVEKCGGSLDAWSIAWLFGELESIAGDQIAKVVALAQTTDPNAMRKHGLPKILIDNATALKKHNETQGHKNVSSKGGSATSNAQSATKVKNEIKEKFNTWNCMNKKERGTQQEFAEAMCKEFKNAVQVNTITKKWIPEWRKPATSCL